jgi:hypothetical protein
VSTHDNVFDLLKGLLKGLLKDSDGELKGCLEINIGSDHHIGNVTDNEDRPRFLALEGSNQKTTSKIWLATSTEIGTGTPTSKHQRAIHRCVCNAQSLP